MKLTNSDVDIFVPDGSATEEALERTTHLAIGAHQDDLEFMALHGILECCDRDDRWFTGVTAADGSGSPRTGPYAEYSDGEMSRVRIEEQRRAASLGRYGCQIQLMYSSSELKDPTKHGPVNDLSTILEFAKPEVAYLHNPADKHDTHVACCLRAIDALRGVSQDARPAKVYGCEVWRDLDWLADSDKVALPLDDPDGLGAALAKVFDSQIAGGKRYDLAVLGRRTANATFFDSHEVDRYHALTFAMDLTPLVEDHSLDVADFTLGLLGNTAEDISDRILRMNWRG